MKKHLLPVICKAWLITNLLFPAGLSAQYIKLFDFDGATSGKNPYHGSFISDGTFLYGMTTYGGTNDMGTIFKIKPDGTNYSKLLDFAGTSNGSYPYGSLVSDGTFLYGMTQYGGANVSGTIFKIKPDGTGYSKLLDLNDTASGRYPFGSLIYDGGFLYGMASEGGANSLGTVFKILPDGTGFSTLYNFAGGTDGSYPKGSLVSDDTFLYGLTQSGGTNDYGTIFKIKPDGTGYSKLLHFQGASNGRTPNGSLIYDGTFLYGLTQSGGTNDGGTIFKINPDGTGYFKLLDFFGSNGRDPQGSLVSDGTFLYGVTLTGGAIDNFGALFRIKTDGTNYSKLFDFDGTKNGRNPRGSLIFDGASLWGMTYGGGANDLGTIFKFYLPCALPSAPAICAVTVDSVSKYNIILWDKTPFIGTAVDSFIVHREVQSNIYLPIGAVHFDSLSQFIDTVRSRYFVSPYFSLGDPNAGTYRYKLQVRDTCGNYSALSPYHNTIFMTNNSGTFSWPQLYSIQGSSNPVTQYLLMRDNQNNGNWAVINSVAGTQQSITDPQYATWQGTANWRIETQWGISCTPTRMKNGTFNSSLSNAFKPTGSGVNENPLENYLKVYPNPSNGIFSIELTDNLNAKTIEVRIYDILGEELFAKSINGRYQTIILPDFRKGIYLLQVGTDVGNFYKKIIIK